MAKRPFTVTLEPEQIAAIQALAETLHQSASGIMRGAALAVLDDPSILLRPALDASKRARSRDKVST